MFSERSIVIEDAIKNIKNEFDSLEISFEISVFGDELNSTCCVLKDKQGMYITDGYGKGLGRQAIASAMYEAMEHFSSETANFHQLEGHKSSLRLISVEDLTNCEELLKEKSIRILRNSPKAAGKKLNARVYQNLYTDVCIDVPYYLNAPDYFSHPLSDVDRHFIGSSNSYSCNNGIAAGSTQDDALLHAVCEILERDCRSNFLIDCFLKADTVIELIDPLSLSIDHQKILSKIENEVSSEVIIFNLPNQYGIHCFGATIAEQNLFLTYPCGYGASLSKNYAVERALLELLQIYHIYTTDKWSVDPNIDLKDIIDRLDKYPKYKACAIFDLRKVLKDCKYVSLDFRSLNDYCNNNDSTSQMLRRIYDNLGCIDRSIYFTQEYRSDNIICVNVIIPGAERFFLVQSGMLVLPNKDIYVRK